MIQRMYFLKYITTNSPNNLSKNWFLIKMGIILRYSGNILIACIPRMVLNGMEMQQHTMVLCLLFKTIESDAFLHLKLNA